MLNLVELAELIARNRFDNHVGAFKDWIRNDDRVLIVVDYVVDVLLLLDDLDFSHDLVASREVRVVVDVRRAAQECVGADVAAADRRLVVRSFLLISLRDFRLCDPLRAARVEVLLPLADPLSRRLAAVNRQLPIAAFALLVLVSRNFREEKVQRQVVAN